MMAEKWNRVSEIFERAIELPLEQRDKFVDESCGDDAELRHEVESLLISYDEEPAMARRRSRRKQDV